MKKKIKAISDNQTLFGTIEILNKTDKTAYVIWSIFDQENKLVASLTNNYFLGNKDFNNEEIFNIVKNQILKYRIGRKRKFSFIEFDT